MITTEKIIFIKTSTCPSLQARTSRYVDYKREILIELTCNVMAPKSVGLLRPDRKVIRPRFNVVIGPSIQQAAQSRQFKLKESFKQNYFDSFPIVFKMKPIFVDQWICILYLNFTLPTPDFTLAHKIANFWKEFLDLHLSMMAMKGTASNDIHQCPQERVNMYTLQEVVITCISKSKSKSKIIESYSITIIELPFIREQVSIHHHHHHHHDHHHHHHEH
uniref:Uncharacterized protein n=1 Tax=Glossina pallidipes TaxID=7398 RepID=A0A1A9ZXV3_GLOPL